MATCFHCGQTIHRYHLPSKQKADNHWTADHLYPSTLVNSLTKAQADLLPADFSQLNRVNCCNACNQYKGRLHPLDWLVIMRERDGAKRLAQRLVKMGEDMAEVFDAMRRRRK